MNKKTFQSDFSEQYKSPKWQKKRLEVLEYFKYKCVDCGNLEKQLHVHHIIYIKDRKIWEYEVGELICVCDDCHKLRHDMKIKIDLCIGNISVFTQAEILSMLSLMKSIYRSNGICVIDQVKLFKDIIYTMTLGADKKQLNTYKTDE